MKSRPTPTVAARPFLVGRGRRVGHRLIVAPRGAGDELQDSLLSELAEPEPNQPITFRRGTVAGRAITVASVEVEAVANGDAVAMDRHGRPLVPVMGLVVDGDTRIELGADQRYWFESMLRTMYHDFLANEEAWTVPPGPVVELPVAQDTSGSDRRVPTRSTRDSRFRAHREARKLPEDRILVVVTVVMLALIVAILIVALVVI